MYWSLFICLLTRCAEWNLLIKNDLSIWMEVSVRSNTVDGHNTRKSRHHLIRKKVKNALYTPQHLKTTKNKIPIFGRDGKNSSCSFQLHSTLNLTCFGLMTNPRVSSILSLLKWLFWFVHGNVRACLYACVYTRVLTLAPIWLPHWPACMWTISRILKKHKHDKFLNDVGKCQPEHGNCL